MRAAARSFVPFIVSTVRGTRGPDEVPERIAESVAPGVLLSQDSGLLPDSGLPPVQRFASVRNPEWANIPRQMVGSIVRG